MKSKSHNKAMNVELFKKFENYRSKGLKKQASKAIKEFVASFQNEDEKREFTEEYLNSLPEGEHEKIRHELFEKVVFPILLRGYKRSDLWSSLMLVRFVQNLYSAEKLHKEIGYKSDFSILKEAYELHPEHKKTRKKLLLVQVRWFEHCVHEWPSGILYGMDGATKSEVNDILSELELAREIDVTNQFSEFFDSFEEKVNIYKNRHNNGN